MNLRKKQIIVTDKDYYRYLSFSENRGIKKFRHVNWGKAIREEKK